jgi:ATP-dependent RNA helicase DHX33
VTGLESLKVERISKAQATQRAGRAGRESSGTCYRLYTEEEYSKFKAFSKPEILRCNLVSVALQLIALGIKDLTTFDFLDKPSDENLKNAVDQLVALSAIECIPGNENKYKLTKTGEEMVIFPIEPRFSRTLIASFEMGCTDEVLTLISLLHVDNLFHVPPNKQEMAKKVIQKFETSEGDHVMLLNVYKAFKAAKGNKEWCSDNFIHLRNMKNALDVRKQLSALCEKSIPKKRTSCGQNTELVRKCLTKGLFQSVALLQKEGHYKTTTSKQEVYIHPSSCLFRAKPEAVIYTELVETTKCYMRNISLMNREWL